MKNIWGKLFYNAKRKHWAVRGTYQGKRLYLSQIPTLTGFVSCETEGLAQQLQLDVSRQIENGIFRPEQYKKQQPLHLKKYAEEWLKIKKPSIAFVTWRGYRGKINNHIIPAIGSEYLPYLTYDKIRSFVNGIQLSAAGKQATYRVLQLMLNDAKKSGYIQEVPPTVTIKQEQKKIKWLGDEAFEKVMELVDPHDRYIIMFMRLTGVRQAEARALRKKDIKSDRIDIKKTFTIDPDGGEMLKICKQDREESIPLYAAVKELLDSMPPRLGEFVFLNKRGKHYSKHIANEVWNKPCEEALGYKFRFNNVGRHSFGSKLAAAGVDMNTIAKLLRHSNVETTKRHYAEVDYGQMASVVNNVQKIGGEK